MKNIIFDHSSSSECENTIFPDVDILLYIILNVAGCLLPCWISNLIIANSKTTVFPLPVGAHTAKDRSP